MKLQLSVLFLAVTLLGGCSANKVLRDMATPPEIAPKTKSEKILRSIPPAKEKIAVSVYAFNDQTGQHKPSDTTAQFSRAVTQGGLSILSEALLAAGNHNWFSLVERQGLDNLLQERKIIRMMREQYAAPDGSTLPKISPMVYAGMILEGGIISYDSNIITGGLGARYLGVGGSTQYRRDLVNVYLRAINVTTGEVMLSVNTAKTIYSTSLQGDAFRFVAFDKLLEAESGFTVNEPPHFAVRQAIEMAVYSLVMEGAMKGLWGFEDSKQGEVVLLDYLKRKKASKEEINNARRRILQNNLKPTEIPKQPTRAPKPSNVNAVKQTGAKALPNARPAERINPAAIARAAEENARAKHIIKPREKDELFDEYYNAIVSPLDLPSN